MLNVISGLLAGGVAASTNSYESIATAYGSLSSGSITFTSIPSTYKHLQVRIFGNTNRSDASIAYGVFTVNGDTSANYSWHMLTGDGSAASAGAGANASNVPLQITGGSTSAYGVSIIDILDYQNTNKYKTFRNLNGIDINGAGGEVNFVSGSWRSTSAINSFTITGGYNVTGWTTDSVFALYGIKG